MKNNIDFNKWITNFLKKETNKNARHIYMRCNNILDEAEYELDKLELKLKNIYKYK